MEVQHRPHIAVRQFLLVICITQERKRESLDTNGRFDTVRDILLIGNRIEIAQIVL